MKQLNKVFIIICSLLFFFVSCEKDEIDNSNLFYDGEFETLNTISDNWTISRGILILDDSIKYEGNYSLLITQIDDYDSSDLYSKLIEVKSKVTYELSFWYKIYGTPSCVDDFLYGFKQDQEYISGLGYSFLGYDSLEFVDIDWTYHTETLIFPVSSPINMYIHANLNVWIDNLTLKRK